MSVDKPSPHSRIPNTQSSQIHINGFYIVLFQIYYLTKCAH